MNKRDRVLAAIGGLDVDRVPSSYSLHFPKEGHSGTKAVEMHLEFFRETETEILKIMNEHLMPFIGPIQSPGDWRAVKSYGKDASFIVKQLDLVKALLDQCGGEGYVVATVHGVCASTIHTIERAHGYDASRKLMSETLRSHETMMVDVHRRVTDTVCQLVEGLMDAGVDGIYYAALGGEKHYYTDEEFEQHIKPYDIQIMDVAKQAGGHVFLHICKENINMDRYTDYGTWADVVNWGVYETDFPIEDGKALFPDRAIMGGLPNRGAPLVEGPLEDIQEAVQEVIRRHGPRHFIVGADCTLPTDIPYERIRTAVRATEI